MSKTLFIDLDGTLMKKDLSLSSNNIQALKRALNQGNQIVLTSGRPILFTKYIAAKIDSRVQCIGFNGAYSEIGIDIIIPYETLLEVNQIAKKYNLQLLAKSLNHVYSNKEIISYFAYKISDNEQVSYSEHIDYKFLGMYNHQKDIEEVKKAFKSLPINFESKGNRGYEITNQYATKGEAVLTFCNKKNISLKDCICIGDDYNDISMFKLGAYNVVMMNADDKIKKYAHFIAPHFEEDAVAYVIEKLLVKEF